MNYSIYLYYIIYCIYIHLIASNMEYILHRFLMHNENNYYGYNHVHHHKNTDKNMNIININRKEYENKKIEGDNLIFQPKESIILMIVLSDSDTTDFCPSAPTSVLKSVAFLFISPATISAMSAFAIIIALSLASCKSGLIATPTP